MTRKIGASFLRIIHEWAHAEIDLESLIKKNLGGIGADTVPSRLVHNGRSAKPFTDTLTKTR